MVRIYIFIVVRLLCRLEAVLDEEDVLLIVGGCSDRRLSVRGDCYERLERLSGHRPSVRGGCQTVVGAVLSIISASEDPVLSVFGCLFCSAFDRQRRLLTAVEGVIGGCS